MKVEAQGMTATSSVRQRRRRGSAALLVLLVLSLLTVIGFAMGDLCVVHLNLSRRYLSAARAQLLAQAAVQQFTVTFDKASAKLRERGLDLDRREADTLGLETLYASSDGLPDPAFDDMRATVALTFDAQSDWCSTDNSLSEYPRASWLDRGTSAKSVPPFAVELLVTVNVDGQVHHYRALISRRWPFAVFCPRGSIALCGSPADSGGVVDPTVVEGPVGTLGGSMTIGWKSATAELPISTTVGGQTFDEDGKRVPTPVAGDELSPEQRILALNRLEPRCEVLVERPICIGPPLRYAERGSLGFGSTSSLPADSGQIAPSGSGLPDVEVREVQLEPTEPTRLPGQSAPSDPPLLSADETQNVLDGDVNVPSSLHPHTPAMGRQESEAVRVYPGNTLSGRVIAGFASGLDDKHNPADDAVFPSADGYESLPVPPLPDAARASLGMLNGSAGEGVADFGFLCGTLSLDPDQATAPPLHLGGHNKWAFMGSMGNRCVAVKKPLGNPTMGTGGVKGWRDRRPAQPDTYQIVQTSGGLQLRNTVLYIDGNLDLSSDAAGRHVVGIEGSNSTLIVNGTLALSGGRLDSRDQGLVILANDIVLRAHGDYRGLIIAKNSLTILSDVANTKADAADKTLTIRGGILCGNRKKGNVILRSVRVVYDPVYMKSVHAYGDAICTAWKEIR